MMFYVEISDEDGKTFNMEIFHPLSPFSDPLFTYQGTWRTLDKGFIRYNHGTNKTYKSPGTSFTFDLYLFNLKNTWGIRLNQFNHLILGPNMQGSGTVIQPWVLSLRPGFISWRIYFMF
ncbi:MAG: hypothetical protein R2747_08100 [Pyrinomonadaceae bacterium]